VWVGVSHRLLAGGGESRRAQRASNDPEVIMSNALAHASPIAHEKALEAAGDAITLVLRVPSDRRRRGLPLTLPPPAVAAAVAGARNSSSNRAHLIEFRKIPTF
jgi:hypothetical protein